MLSESGNSIITEWNSFSLLESETHIITKWVSLSLWQTGAILLGHITNYRHRLQTDYRMITNWGGFIIKWDGYYKLGQFYYKVGRLLVTKWGLTNVNKICLIKQTFKNWRSPCSLFQNFISFSLITLFITW